MAGWFEALILLGISLSLPSHPLAISPFLPSDEIGRAFIELEFHTSSALAELVRSGSSRLSSAPAVGAPSREKQRRAPPSVSAAGGAAAGKARIIDRFLIGNPSCILILSNLKKGPEICLKTSAGDL